MVNVDDEQSVHLLKEKGSPYLTVYRLTLTKGCFITVLLRWGEVHVGFPEHVDIILN